MFRASPGTIGCNIYGLPARVSAHLLVAFLLVLELVLVLVPILVLVHVVVLVLEVILVLILVLVRVLVLIVLRNRHTIEVSQKYHRRRTASSASNH